MNPMILTMPELRESYIASKLVTDKNSDRETLESEFNRALLRYLQLNMETLIEYFGELKVVVDIPKLQDTFNFFQGFARGAADEFRDLSNSAHPELNDLEYILQDEEE